MGMLKYYIINNVYLVEWALFSVQGEETRPANGVPTPQTDWAPGCRVKLIAAHGAGQEFSPLRRLNRHPPVNCVQKFSYYQNQSKSVTKTEKHNEYESVEDDSYIVNQFEAVKIHQE
jgi:hypothetical protein